MQERWGRSLTGHQSNHSWDSNPEPFCCKAKELTIVPLIWIFKQVVFPLFLLEKKKSKKQQYYSTPYSIYYSTGESRRFCLSDTENKLIIVPHPVWKVTDSFICHKLQDTTVCHSVWVLVGQLKKHRIGDVKPACTNERKTIIGFIEGTNRTIMKKCLI